MAKGMFGGCDFPAGAPVIFNKISNIYEVEMNIKDIAKLAGVSVSTVSKVMNGKDASIGKETRDRVLRIAKDYNYTPYASVLVPNIKTFRLGVLFRSAETAQSTLSGILAEARNHGYSVSVADSSGDPEEELKAISGFCKNKADAVLWEPTKEADKRCMLQLSDAGIPYFIFHAADQTAFNIDYSLIGYKAVQTLIDNGHQNIACILADGTRTPGFFEGYKKCLFDNQIPLREELIFHEVSSLLFYQIITHEISALVCSHFSAALKLYDRCQSLHYHAPDDFSLISLMDDARLKMEYPQISTYTIPHFRFGAFLCRRAIARIEKQSEETGAFIPNVSLDNTATVDIPPSQRARKITVVGSINIDNYLNVSQLPSSGKTVRTLVSSVYPGGKATNEAIGAAKLGHHVSLLGNVGGDMDSNLIYDALNEYAVDTSGLKRYPEHQTGKAYIIVEPSGDSMISILSGASEFLRPEDLRSRERIFENTGYTLINTEIPIETVTEACLLTRKYGGQTVIKPSALNHIPEETLPYIDILIPNLNEMNELSPKGETLSEKAEYFLKRGVQVVIVTLGADGCFVKTQTYEKYFPAIDFTAIDNTGAGDAFISAFASYMLYGYGLERSVRIAGYAAGFSITRMGTVPALIDKNTLETYIRKTEPELLNPKPHRA